MNLKDFKNKLKKTPKAIEFLETMDVIEANYIFEPMKFTLGSMSLTKLYKVYFFIKFVIKTS